MNRTQILLATLLAAATVMAMLGVSAQDVALRLPGSAATAMPTESVLPPLEGATTWLNTKPLSQAELRGKVVLVNFWTYSCINSLRQLPHLRAWAAQYRDKGLVVIGVHAPEFAFERDIGNVRRAVAGLKLDYPVAIDNDHALWRAFGNQYWPALYFVDARGRVRYRKFGEGDYPKLEAALRQLLADAGARGLDHAPATVDARGVEADADWNDLRSPETYTGYARSERLVSPGGARPDRVHDYEIPARMRLNRWALSGTWRMGAQALTLDKPGGRITYRFHARDLHLVMGPAKPGMRVRFRIRIDGKPPGAAHGIDVDSAGNGAVTEPRMYQLVRQPMPIVDRDFEIEFLDPGVETFAFTFG